MRIQERCYVGRVMAGVWLLGLVALASGVDQRPLGGSEMETMSIVSNNTSSDTFNASIFMHPPSDGQNDVPSVVPLEGEPTEATIKMTTQNSKINSSVTTIEPTKQEFLGKLNDVKMTTEGKKKLITEFKAKTEAKYQKIKEEDKINDSTTTPMSVIEKLVEIKNATEGLNVPFLVRGEPIASLPENMTTINEGEESEESTMVNTSRGRALNISAAEQPTNSLHANLTDLSDVSMDDEDKEVEGGEYQITKNETAGNMSSTVLAITPMRCVDGNKTFAIGEEVVRGCEEKCICSEGGKITDCGPVCEGHLFARNSNKDAYCWERPHGDDKCCVVLVCADSEQESEETCIVGNETISRGQRHEVGCSEVCICEAQGVLKCHPRCPPNETTSGVNQHDRCVALKDPGDACCTITLCDVTLGDHEIKAENSGDLSVNLTNVKVINSTAIKLKTSSGLSNDLVVEISEDNHVWRQQKPDKNGIVTNLEPAHSYFVRVTEGGRTGPALQVFLPAEVIKTNITEKVDKNSCSHRGKLYKIGAEWYDECISFCVCGEGPKTECLTIECPTDFGLDILDPKCLDWETVPANFVPKAPQCCPQEVRCRNNGSCMYEGSSYDNWSELPSNVTGCEKRCYCDMGNVTCQAACPPVTALPPPNLNCPSNQAILANLPGDDCCSHWVCDRSGKETTVGMDVTHGPLSIEQKLISPNKSSIIVHASQESSSVIPPDHQNPDKNPNNSLFHYPMDPGHPTMAYNGPYNPDYKPVQPSIDQVFRLPGHSDKQKDKSKTKSDTKKPLEPLKPHKDTTSSQQYGHQDDNDRQKHQQQSTPNHFPGPLAPDKFPTDKLPPMRTKIIENPNLTSPSTKPNKLPPQDKPSHTSDQPQFIPLKPQPEAPRGPYVFVPSNGENIPPTHFVNQYQNPDAGPPYGGPALHGRPEFHDPNFVVPNVPKKKIISADTYVDGIKTKPGQIAPGKTKPTGQMTEQEILPEELYRLINQQHPGLTHLEHAPPQGHPGLYDIHRQIAPPKNPQDYYNQMADASGNNNNSNNNKNSRPTHIVSQKDENGQTTYHVHTSELPNSPQQIEELLAHITQHESSLSPFHYQPGHPPIGHNFPDAAGPPPLPPGIDIRLPASSSSPHLNHPFAAQALPNQSGMNSHNVPSGFPIHGGIPSFANNGQGLQGSHDEVSVKALEALDEGTIRIVFMVPPIFVGLQARVDLRYTSDMANPDPLSWKSQIFKPPNEIIATSQLEFDLDGLEPSTDYKVKVTVNLRGLENSPSSKVYSVRTLDRHEEVPTLPPQIPVDAELKLVEGNSTWINVMWKKFTEYEMQFIDGVQLRYKEHDGKVYAATPLIHRAVTTYVIENLKPSTNYEIGISIIPFPGQTTELISEKTIQVTTAVKPDPYSFDIKVEIKTIKSTGVEVSWSGVPYPEDKYVNIYRAIYQSDSGKEDTSTFKIVKRDSPAKTLVTDLKPGTRYRLWIEVYLTNGRIKKSNVQDFVTKPGIPLSAGVSQQGQLASIPLHEGDYYGPLVIVAIVASLAILSTLILLMMLMKRRSSSKADISPRKTTAAYDNPSYKTCEDATQLTNGHNKSADHQMTTINANSDAKETA